jgi:hypothetical protein
MADPPRSLSGYYITPTHDFRQYVRDYEEKYWAQDTAFDWQQDVPANLKRNLDLLSPGALWRIAALALPLVEQAQAATIRRIEEKGLPLDRDELKAVAEQLPGGRSSIEDAMLARAPLAELQSSVHRLTDRLAILQRHLLELREQHRLRLFKEGTTVRRLDGAGEARVQAEQLSTLAGDVRHVERALAEAKRHAREEGGRLAAALQARLAAVAPRVRDDLQDARALVRRAIDARAMPNEHADHAAVLQLIQQRQVRGLKDIANHALVVEQSAIAPLTVGIIHYKRRREIQEAMTTFVNDEAKHSAVFRRFMVDRLEASERVPQAIIRGGDRYLWLARFLPSAAVFLAVIVEAIGGAYLEFFGKDDNMPDPLFRSICRTIAERDEKRHQDLCAETYNELYRTGTRWEQQRNRFALRVLMQSAYGDKTEDHHLIQACRAFGLDSRRPYHFIADRLSEQLSRVGTYMSPADLLASMGVSASARPDEGGG